MAQVPPQAQTASVVSAAQAEPESRAAVLHALFVLRIAPYLNASEARRPEAPTTAENDGKKGREKEKDKDKEKPKEQPDRERPNGKTPPAPKEPPDPKPEKDKPPEPPKPRKGDEKGTEPAKEPGKEPGTDKRDDGAGKDKGAGKGQQKPQPRPYRIGLVGQDDVVGVAPRQLAGKKVGDRLAVTVEVPLDRATTAAGDYDLLYIANSVEPEVVQKILATHAGLPVPLISTRNGFAAAGGGVQLFVQDNAVRFEVNAEVLRKQGVHVDSQLQKLSRRGPR